MRRAKVEVIATEDGTALEYQIIDIEEPFTLVPAVQSKGITRVEANHAVHVGKIPDIATSSILTSLGMVGGGMIGGPVGLAFAMQTPMGNFGNVPGGQMAAVLRK